MVIKILAAWFGISLPASLILGALINVGRGQDWNDKECQSVDNCGQNTETVQLARP